MAPTVPRAVPRADASHLATPARTAFLPPRNTLPTCRPFSPAAIGGRNTRARYTPGWRSVMVATEANVHAFAGSDSYLAPLGDA